MFAGDGEGVLAGLVLGQRGDAAFEGAHVGEAGDAVEERLGSRRSLDRHVLVLVLVRAGGFAEVVPVGDERQALAVTLGLMLLVGGVLLLRETAGVWAAFGVGVGLVLAGYAALAVAREIAVRRWARRLRRG